MKCSDLALTHPAEPETTGGYVIGLFPLGTKWYLPDSMAKGYLDSMLILVDISEYLNNNPYIDMKYSACELEM